VETIANYISDVEKKRRQVFHIYKRVHLIREDNYTIL